MRMLCGHRTVVCYCTHVSWRYLWRPAQRLPNGVGFGFSRSRAMSVVGQYPQHKLAATQTSCKNDRVALLIDGDAHGPKTWSLMRSALSRQGIHIVATTILGIPQNADNNVWKQEIHDLAANFVPVPRRAGGSKDPNDIALAMEATRYVSLREATAVAIAVNDSDFLYLASRMHTWGYRTIALFRHGSLAFLASQFEAMSAEVIRFGDVSQETTRTKMKAVLHLNGEGSVEPFAPDASFGKLVDDAPVAKLLQQHDYLVELDGPIVPALAKFYHCNAVGPLTVWPEMCPRIQAQAEILEGSNSWKTNPGNLIYVFPWTNGKSTKHYRLTYGSVNAARWLHAGGPFLLEDSASLPELVLRKLGYLDDCYNTDVGEAIDSFAHATKNRYQLELLGVSIPKFYSMYSKRAMLHSLLVSPQVQGGWQIAPSDQMLRQFLVAKKLITAPDCCPNEAFEALHHYAKKQDLPACRNYNTLVGQVLTSMNDQPSKRASTRS